MTMWWLSFCDDRKPKGAQFLGLCIVEAVDEITAVKITHALGINPGGEVGFMDLIPEKVARLSFDLLAMRDRFIPRDEALALADRIRAEVGE